MTWSRFASAIPPSVFVVVAALCVIGLGWALVLAAAVQGGRIEVDAGVVSFVAELEETDDDTRQ